jgi:hypothetical protein
MRTGRRGRGCRSRDSDVVKTEGVFQPAAVGRNEKYCRKKRQGRYPGYSAPHRTDEKIVILGSGNTRTLANPRENPSAVSRIMEPGKSIID